MQLTTSHQKDQAERKSLAGSTIGMTLHSQAITQIELEGQGRHAAAAKASVVGAERVPLYPRQGPDSPWSSDISGVEPPFGIDVSFVEPVGTPAEVEESLRVVASLLPSGAAANEATAEGSNLPLLAGAADASTQQYLSPAVDASASSPEGAILNRQRRL
jgi:hypothetical protein